MKKKLIISNQKYSFLILMILVFFISCSKKPEEYFPESSLTDLQEFSGKRGIDAFSENSQQNQNQTPEIFVQMGHISGTFNYTNAVEFMSDGKHILTGNGDGTIKLWETTTGREVKTFRCKDDVMSIDISNDGKYLVSGDRYHVNNINIWDISTGKKLSSFDGFRYPSVVFCNNDSNILVADWKDGVYKLFDIQTGKIIKEFKIESGEATIVMTNEGKRAVFKDDSYSANCDLNIWDKKTTENILNYRKEKKHADALLFTQDGKSVLSGGHDQDSVRVWNINTGKQTNAYPGYTSVIDISSGERYALFGGYMGFRLVELSTGKEIRKIDKGIDGYVRSIKFSPDGKYALVGDYSSKPMLWDLETGTIAREYGGYTNQVETVKISKSGNVMLTADDYNDMIKIWDYNNGRLIKTIDRDSSSIMSSATISNDGKLMATGGWNGRTSNAIIWDVATSKQITRMELENENGSHTQFLHITDDNKYLVWAMEPSYIIISDLHSGKEIKKISASSINPENIFVDPNGKYIIAPTYEECTKVFSFPEGEFIALLNEEISLGCIIGEENIYSFTSGRDELGLREEFLTTYDPLTLKEKIKKREYLGIVRGIEYNKEFLFIFQGIDLVRYDLNQNKVVAKLSGHTDNITNIDITPDGKFICSSSYDGTTRFWDPETCKEVAQFISFSDGEWIVITPEGYFNASPNGAKYLNVRVGNEVYSIDNFYEKYYNPAYVASVLQGKNVEPVTDIRDGVALPPEVRIISPETNSELKNEEVTITVSAKDIGGGIDEIRLYHNGKVVSEEKRGIKIVTQGNENSKSYTVKLVDGINRFRATGFSKDRTESNPAEIMVKLIAPPKDVSMHVFTVGINKYENPALNLNYAEPDAKGIVDFFRQSGKKLFKNVDITEFYNEQATKEGILAKMKQLENTNPQDAVLIYLAGHGENINEKWYFIPYELTYPEREEDVVSKAISSDELSTYIRNIKAQKILVLIDACKSGAALLAFRGFEDRKALSQLSRATGVHIVAASNKDQYATEVKELGHGVFTYTLLEGLNGKAAAKGEAITVRKLMSYIEEQLPELTKKYRQEAQYPVVDSKGMDFPLVIGY